MCTPCPNVLFKLLKTLPLAMTSLAIFLELCNGSQRFCQKEKPLLSPLQCWRTEKEPWTQIRTWFEDRLAVLAALGWRMVLFLFFMEEKLRPREMKTCPRQDRKLGAKPSRMLSSLLSPSLGSWNSQVQCGEVGLQKLWDSGFFTEQEDSRLSNDREQCLSPRKVAFMGTSLW